MDKCYLLKLFFQSALVIESFYTVNVCTFYYLPFITQVNDLRTRIKELSPTESIFLTATMQFRETIKGMFSLQVSAPNVHTLPVLYTWRL